MGAGCRGDASAIVSVDSVAAILAKSGSADGAGVNVHRRESAIGPRDANSGPEAFSAKTGCGDAPWVVGDAVRRRRGCGAIAIDRAAEPEWAFEKVSCGAVRLAELDQHVGIVFVGPRVAVVVTDVPRWTARRADGVAGGERWKAWRCRTIVDPRRSGSQPWLVASVVHLLAG